MRLTFLFFLIFSVHFTFGQNDIIDSMNYQIALKNAGSYKMLILKDNVYGKFKMKEKDFLNVEKIILTGVKNLILPKTFSDFQNLKELIIVNSNEINLDVNLEVISNIEKLNILEINNCGIKEIPEKIILLNKTPILKISFSFNNIKCLSKNMDKLKVSSLDLSGNPIGKTAFKILSKNNFIEDLDLDKCSISNFPSELQTMKSLKELNLTFNKIKYIQPFYTGFQKLELLILTGNPMEEVKVRFNENKNVIVDFVK